MIISSECPRQLARSQSVPSSLYRHDYLKEELAVWADRIKASGATRPWAYFNYDNDAHAPKRGSNIYVAIGDSGQGLTHGVIGAMLNASLILDQDNPWKELYAPGRVPLKAAKNFLTENVTALKSFAEYVAPGELSSLDDLSPGQGGIVRRGLTKIAAYRDEAGALHLHSASCAHVGCHLHWNSFERCWDCPCHGSMFGVEGDPINAPAIVPLAKVKE